MKSGMRAAGLLVMAYAFLACSGLGGTPTPGDTATPGATSTQAAPTATAQGTSTQAQGTSTQAQGTSTQAEATVSQPAGTLTPTSALGTPTAAPTPTPQPTPTVAIDCDLAYELPADVPGTIATGAATDAGQLTFDQASWKTFLALAAPTVGGSVSTSGDNTPQWAGWSSTVDMIECVRGGGVDCVCPSGDCDNPGSRYYPAECQAVSDFTNYRVFDQVSKVDDSFLEAQTGGLSDGAVIDAQGNFLRYEILVSPATYTYITANDLVDQATLESSLPINFPCGDEAYTGGDPANAQMGAIVVKAAWMELGALDAADYHTQQILSYLPASRTSTGVATCALKTYALVGLHIAHKTLKQPGWTWATFEHGQNAPDCQSLPTHGNQSAGPSTDCPTVAEDYNLHPLDCSADRCQSCNAVPEQSETLDTCTGPSGTGSWCADIEPRNSPWPSGATYTVDHGLSALCRQVPVESYYPTADRYNRTCAASLTAASVWSQYELISTQWFAKDYAVGGTYTCQNVDGDVFNTQNRSLIAPQVPITADPPGEDPVQTRPFLANTSMESYERSSCISCHAKSQLGSADAAHSTDFMYFLKLEVPTPTPASTQ